MKLVSQSSHAEKSEAQVPPYRGKARFLLFAIAALWVCLVSAGMWILWGYENTPGAGALPPGAWPADSRIQHAKDRATLVMLAHPHCPCTRASIGELALLMADSQGRVAAHVLFLKPAGFKEDWEKTDLWQMAANIPGVIAVIDDNGLEARRFHAATSGQTVLYGADGRLMFTGGITASRGHSGDNAGRSAIVSLVNGESTETAETFVFGCSLLDLNSECQESKDESNRH